MEKFKDQWEIETAVKKTKLKIPEKLNIISFKKKRRVVFTQPIQKFDFE